MMNTLAPARRARTFALLAAALLLLSGCATQIAQRAARMEELNRTIPTCFSDRECELKWSAARSWILANAGMKLQHLTSDFLETYNPPTQSSTALAVRVVKEPMSSGGYRLVVRTWCNNFIGCFPNVMDAALHFNATVNAVGGSQPATARPERPGAASEPPSGGCPGTSMWNGHGCVSR